MRCDGFDQRMNELLDKRQAIDEDSELQNHILGCEECYQKALIWQQLDGVLAGKHAVKPVSDPVSTPWTRVAVLAAGLLLTIVLTWNYQDRESTGSRVAELTEPSVSIPVDPPLRNLNSESTTPRELDPNRWWKSVEPGEWISQTMPTVRTVRDSVRPLSRSFRQAVDLLTFGRAT